MELEDIYPAVLIIVMIGLRPLEGVKWGLRYEKYNSK